MRTAIHALRAVVATLSIAGAFTPALAATVVCGGAVSVLGYHANGLVMLQLENMNTPVFICSIDTNWEPLPGYITTPAVCKTMYGSFLAAKLSGTPVNNVYFDMTTAPASCNAFAGWSNASVRHYLQ